MLEGGADVEEMHKPESAETVHEAVEEHVEDCEVEERAEQAGEQAPAETELKEQCEQLERLNAELANQLLRLRADFENYRRRTRSQIEEIKAQASADLMITAADPPVILANVQSAEQTDYRLRRCSRHYDGL